MTTLKENHQAADLSKNQKIESLVDELHKTKLQLEELNKDISL